MLPSVDQAWFARYVHRYDDPPHRGCARARGAGDSVGTAPAAAPYGSAVRGTRERLIHTGTSEKDTGPRTGSNAAAGFFMAVDGRGFRGGNRDEAVLTERRRPQGTQGSTHRDPRLRQPGTCPRAQFEGLGLRCG